MRNLQSDSRHIIASLRKEQRQTDKKLDKLMDAVAEGLVEDTHAFRTKHKELENCRRELVRLITQEERKVSLPPQALSNAQIDRFAGAIREMLSTGPIAFRKAYLNLLIEDIIVSHEQIIITGSKAALAAAAIHGRSAPAEEVRSFARDLERGSGAPGRIRTPDP